MKLLINNNVDNPNIKPQYVEGILRFSGDLNDGTGSFFCNEYVEEIFNIQSDRFLVSGIDVVQEHGGTNNYFICYNFNYDSCVYLGDPLSAQERLDYNKQIFGVDRIDERYIEFDKLDIFKAPDVY